MTNEPEKKEEHCKTGDCGKGSCGMKLCSPCGMIKIVMLVVALVFVVNYFMK